MVYYIVNVKVNCNFDNNKLKMLSFDAVSNERILIRRHNDMCFKTHIKMPMKRKPYLEFIASIKHTFKLDPMHVYFCHYHLPFSRFST